MTQSTVKHPLTPLTPLSPLSLKAKHKETLSELEKYKLLVESVEDYAIFLLDPTGHITTWNKGAQRFKGYKPEEIIGKHFSVFYQQSDIDADKPGNELRVAREVGRIEDEDWRVRKDGSRFWANVIITTLRDKDGEIVGFAKVTRDLTERKLQELQLREANELLERQRQELEKLNNSKDEFISLASHQLRTPATATKQMLGILLEGFLGDISEQHIEPIRKAYESNERQLSIVNSLLQVAQVDAGRVELHMQPSDIGALVTSVVDEQRDSIAKRQQIIKVHLPTEPVTASIDTKYFWMAIENIIDNASKYSPDSGKIDVTVTQDKEAVRIDIQDNGIGIAKDDMDKLFVKFQRVPNERTQAVSGSGLGLYWVKKVLSLHDAAIDVSSRLRHGTTFTITLAVLHAPPIGEAGKAA